MHSQFLMWHSFCEKICHRIYPLFRMEILMCNSISCYNMHSSFVIRHSSFVIRHSSLVISGYKQLASQMKM
jgi:hypothetical protein